MLHVPKQMTFKVWSHVLLLVFLFFSFISFVDRERSSILKFQQFSLSSVAHAFPGDETIAYTTTDLSAQKVKPSSRRKLQTQATAPVPNGSPIRCFFTASGEITKVFLGTDDVTSSVVGNRNSWAETKTLDFNEPSDDREITVLVRQPAITGNISPRCSSHTCQSSQADRRERPGFQLWCRCTRDESPWNLVTNYKHWESFSFPNANEMSQWSPGDNVNPLTTIRGPVEGNENRRTEDWFQTWWRDFFLTLKRGGNNINHSIRELSVRGGPLPNPISKIWADIPTNIEQFVGFRTNVQVTQSGELEEMVPNQCSFDDADGNYFEFYFSGRCYAYSMKNSLGDGAHWNVALQRCGQINGDMVSVHNLQENFFIFERIGCTKQQYEDNPSHNGGNQCGCRNSRRNGAGSNSNCWLGLVQVQNGVFRWVDSTEYDYTKAFWSSQEPNDVARGDEGEDCTHIWDRDGYDFGMPEGRRGHWNDEPCNRGFAYICTRNAKCPPGFQLISTYSGKNEPDYDPGTCRQCPPGRFRTESMAQESCGPCNEGYFGDAGSVSSTCTAECELGYFCEQGTSRQSQTPCPAGKYGTKTGGISEEDACKTCRPGTYCPPASIEELPCSPGFCGFSGQSDPTCSSPCPAGYYCPAHSSNIGNACPGATWDGPEQIIEAFECGGVDKFCPEGGSSQEDVALGYYTDGGTENTRHRQLICPRGSFCVGGVRYDCPAGTYNDLQGRFDEQLHCKDCPPGYFCLSRTSSSTQNSCGVGQAKPERFFCPGGSTAPTEVTGGHYTIPLGTSSRRNREGQLECNNNEICVDGLKFPRIVLTTSCPAEISVPEMSTEESMGLTIGIDFNENLVPSDHHVTFNFNERDSGFPYDFHIESSQDCAPEDSRDKNGDNLFVIDQSTGEMKLTRFFDANVDREDDESLNYEVCLPELDIRYVMDVVVRAERTAEPNIGLISEIICPVTVTVLDQNDKPYFENEVEYRIIDEKRDRNSPIDRCSSADEEETGCIESTGDAEVEAFDEDFGSVILYSITPGVYNQEEEPSEQLFKIDDCSGLITMTQTRAINYSDPNIPKIGGSPAFRLEVVATDDGNGGRFPPLSATQEVIVYIRNVNDPPVLVDQSFEIEELQEKGTTTIPEYIIAYDEDGDPITFNVITNANDGKFFRVREGTNILETTEIGARDIDYESSSTKTLNIEIEALDDKLASTRRSFTVGIIDTNDPPRFEDLASNGRYRFFVAENSPDSPLCRTDSSESSGLCSEGVEHQVKTFDVDAAAIAGDDHTEYSLDTGDEYFTIDETTGQLHTKSGSAGSFDFEEDPRLSNVATRTGRRIQIQIRATSDGVGVTNPPVPRSSVITADVFIVDVNEAPEFPNASLPNLQVLESAPRQSLVPLDDKAEDFVAEDPDNRLLIIRGVPVEPQKITYSIVSAGGNADGATFFRARTTSDEKVEIVIERDLSYETAPTDSDDSRCPENKRCYVVNLRVTDNGNPERHSEAPLIIEIINTNNPPRFEDGNTPSTLQINEDIDISTINAAVNIGGALFAVDPDPGDSIAYELIQGNTRFELIDNQDNTFQIRKKAGIYLNFEDPVRSFTIVVRASDNGPNRHIGGGCSNPDGVDPQTLCGGPGAFCGSDGRCYETCVDTVEGTRTAEEIQDADPILWYFCDYDGETPVQKFPESVETSITVEVLDLNDPPRFVIDGQQRLGIEDCLLSGSVARNRENEPQTLFPQITVQDEDEISGNFGGPPFSFSQGPINSEFWDTFNLVEASIGRVRSIANEDLVGVGHIFNGSISVEDSNVPSGLSSCRIQALVSASNQPPDLGEDRVVHLREDVAIGTEILANFASSLEDIDPDVAFDDFLIFETDRTSGVFSIDSQTGRLVLGSRGLNYERNQQESIIVRVTDSFGASDTALVTIIVEDVNEAPFWPSGSLNVFEVKEDANEGDEVGIPFSDIAEDPDTFADNPKWNELEFILVGCDGTVDCPFVLDSSNQTQLLVSEHADFDFSEGVRTWQFGVIARDKADLEDGGPLSSPERDFTVNLLSVPKPPIFISGRPNISIPENDNNDASIPLFDMSLIVFDPDEEDTIDVLDFIFDGEGDDLFFVENGKLFANGPIDYEDKRLYTFSLTVNDTTGLTVTEENMEIFISNVDDVEISSVTTSENPLPCNALSLSQPVKVTLQGKNFGLKSQSPPASIQLLYSFSTNTDPSSTQYEAANCEVTSDPNENNEITCDVVPGVGIDLLWELKISVNGTTIDEDGDSLSTGIRYERPEITSVELLAPNEEGIPTIGGAIVRIVGTCLGSDSDELNLSHSSTQRDSWVEYCSSFACYVPTCEHLGDNELECITVPGIGKDISWRIRIARRQSSNSFIDNTEIISYLAPTISSMSETVLPTRGNRAFVIQGSNFGAQGTSPSTAKITYQYTDSFTGETNQQMSFNMKNCVVSSVDRNEIACTGVDPGIGTNLFITIEFGNQENEDKSVVFVSYEAPLFTEFSGEGQSGATTAGGQLVNLNGDNFGPRCGLPGSPAGDGRACGRVFAKYSRGSTKASDPSQELVYYPPCAVVSQTRITCTTVPGTGSDLEWELEVGSQEVIVPGTTSYGPPSVGGFDGDGARDANTEGGDEVLLSGSNFGPLDGATITASYSSENDESVVYHAENCTVSVAHIEIRCYKVEGVGDRLSWVVVVDEQESIGQLTNYGEPEITDIEILNSDGSVATFMNNDGGQTIRVIGNNFGPNGEDEPEIGIGPFLEYVAYAVPDAAITYELDGNTCELLSHSEIRCTSLPGIGSDLVWFARVKGQTGPLSAKTTSYREPQILNVSPISGPTNGGTRVRIFGVGFGLCDELTSINIEFGSRSVSLTNVFDNNGNEVNVPGDCPLSTIERAIEFSVPPMIDGTSVSGIPIRLVISSQRFSDDSNIVVEYEDLYFYNPPFIQTIFAEPARSNDPGEVSVTILGRNFCANRDCCRVYYNNIPVSSTMYLSHGHDQIRIFTDDVGELFVRCGSTLDSNVVEFSSFSPSVLGTKPRLDNILYPTVGSLSENLEIWGTSFGLLAPNVTFGTEESTLLIAEIVSHDQVSCSDSNAPDTMQAVSLPSEAACFRTVVKVPEGEGKNLPLVVITGAQPSNPDDDRFEFLSYLPPTISLIEGPGVQSPNPTTGGAAFTITGENFGRAGFGEALIGDFGLLCDVQSWTHTEILCNVPEGEGIQLGIEVVTGDQSSSVFTATRLSYLPPSITSWNLDDGEFLTQGGENVTIIGTNFGRPFAASVSIGSRSCSLVDSSHSEIVCSSPENEGLNHAVQVSVRGQSTTAVSRFNYAPPVLEAISPVMGPTSGRDENDNQLEIELFGKNFGVNAIRFIMDNRNLIERLEPFRNQFLFVNHTYARAWMPRFFGSNLAVRVEVATQGSNDNLRFSYMNPNPTIVVSQDENGNEKEFDVDASVSSGRLPRSAFVPNSRRQRRLDEEKYDDGRNLAGNPPANGYGVWTSDGLGRCEGISSQPDWFWRSSIIIQEDGEYELTRIAYSDRNCVDGSETFQVRIEGDIDDLGPSQAFACGQVYNDEVLAVYFTPLVNSIVNRFRLECSCEQLSVNSEINVVTCSPLNNPCEELLDAIRATPNSLGYGLYLISERIDLYLSEASFNSIAEVDGSTSFKFPDFPTASVEEPELVTVPQGPTDGCWEWESIFEYQERVFQASQTTGVSSIPRKCLRPATLTLFGSNFGSDILEEEGTLRVWLVDEELNQEYQGATTTSKGSHAEKCPSTFCTHTDEKITFQIPFGSGSGLRVRVQVGNQEELVPNVTFSYLPPELLESLPGSIWNRRDFMNAEGNRIEVRGKNFGSAASEAGVIVNGRVCTNAEWQAGDNDIDGQPFISCNTVRDVVGPKSLALCVANQTSFDRVERNDVDVLLAGDLEGVWAEGVSTRGFEAEILSFGVARCSQGDIGRMYELCRECPSGAICEGNRSFTRALAEPTFFRLDLPVFVPDENSDLDPPPLILNPRAEARCAPEQWNATLQREFPDLVLRETCEEFSRCIPPDACMGANECSDGYRYAFDTCVEARESFSDEENSCAIIRDPFTGELIGNDLDCTGQTEPGNACPSGRPWECSKCVVTYPTGNFSEPVGACQCQMPTRCALCSIGSHFRLNGECAKCPDSPELLIAAFFLLAIVVAYGGYQLQKRRFNLAFITIGVDYFQVLAIFASLNVEWPPEILQLYNVFSVFNFDIDITAPECLVPNFEYETKWWMTQALPIAVVAVLFMVYVGYLMFKCVHQGTKANHNSHVARLIATGLIAFYYLYLSVTNRALDVFNCNPVEPDDGNLYTSFTSLSCDGGSLCRCNEPGGIQQRLVPLAVLFLIVYSAGFPLFIFLTWWRHKREIMEDQYLRALDLGDTRDENPNAYDLRKKYSKIYYHFVPEKTYWLLFIVLRKFGIAFAGLILRASPSFQLSVIVLILFVSLVAQVLNRPFMSTSQRTQVVQELEDRAKRAVDEPELAIYPEILSNVQRSLKIHNEQKRKMKEKTYGKGGDMWQGRLSITDGMPRRRPKNLQNRAAVYLADYNTVEMVLLSCGIFVATAGVMFASGRFESRDDIEVQRQTITWLTLLLIVMSIFYYVTIFVAEFSPKAAWKLSKLCRGGQVEEKDDRFEDDVQMEANPMFETKGPEFGDTSELDAKLQASLAELRAEEARNQKLRDELKKKKQKEQESELIASQKGTVPSANRGVTRKQFGQTQTNE